SGERRACREPTGRHGASMGSAPNRMPEAARTRSMRDLLVRSIADPRSAESQVEAALPELIRKASDDPLRDLLSEYHRMTSDRRGRLETLAPVLEVELEGTTSRGVEGILRDELDAIREADAGPVCDAAIIGCAQKVQHYEI